MARIYLNSVARRAHCLFAACLLGASFSALAADIVSVSGSQRDGREIVEIQLSEPINFDPVGFVVHTPARISLDFPGVGVADGRQNVEVNQGNLRAIQAVEAGERSRVVLNLREATPYQVQRAGSTVLVQLGAPAMVTARAPASVVPSAHAPMAAAGTLQGLDFRRGVDGAARIVLDLPTNGVSVDLREEGRKLVLELPNVALPDALRNRLDVTDFGTPVTFVQAIQTGNSTRVEAELEGDWTHSAYQADGQYVLEVRRIEPDPTALTQGVGFTGEKLSLNFQNIEIRALLQVIADFTNFNIVTSDTVQGALTLRLQDVPWDQALQIILDAKDLGYERNGNVLWVAPKEELNARRQRDYEAQIALEQLEPLRTQIFQLNYARSEVIADQLISSGNSSVGEGRSNRFLTNRGSAIAEPRTNQLFVTDTPSKLEEVSRLVASWDVPVRQVLIEARIVEASDSFGRNLGVRLSSGNLSANIGGSDSNRIGFGNSYSGDNPGSGSLYDLGASGFGENESAASFALSIFNSAANRFLNLELSALESTGDGRVISNPRIVTADQVEAFIEQGTEIPYASTAPNGATTVEFKKAVMRLGVTPQITPEGNVILDLEVNKDSPSVAGQGAVDTKKITTQVLVENGGTVVIGGIFELTEQTNVTKVPFLGDLPVAGYLFRRTERSSQKNELLVFITPKILTEQNTMRR
ncbi:secretin [Lampropedia cohaerens]|uniref:Secretin n=1 Tax=Lampropedia cohaerens TaxID=1610491 RepID=A0A0U1Q1K2_9BURK|nr:type IV pilus secretin PilQ family protein [Lampropedia cohaerens]KKW68632.1 secretin [Lampropedia cohaerens]